MDLGITKIFNKNNFKYLLFIYLIFLAAIGQSQIYEIHKLNQFFPTDFKSYI
jgi:hypothetical protein